MGSSSWGRVPGQQDWDCLLAKALGWVEPCAQVLERLAGAVEAEVGPVLSDAFADQAGLSAFNFLAASVLAEADAALAAALPGAFYCLSGLRTS